MTLYTSSGTTTYDDDTNLQQANPTTNYGAVGTFYVGQSASPGTSRELLKFDLTHGTNPPTAGASTISAGTVTLYCESSGATRTVVLYKCLRNWVEGSATWNTYDGTNNWTTAGAGSDGNDYSSTGLGSVVVSAATSYDLPLTADGVTAVQAWINNPSSNYGFLIKDTTESSVNRFTSIEGATAANRPKLTFIYTDSGGGSGYILILNTT
jgi:hypothetical protein